MFIENNLITENRGSENTIAEVDKIKSKDSSLNLLKSTKLTKYWNVRKDNTDVCKNCEFRYFCLDDRIPDIRPKDNSWYYKTECNYNPYIAKWKDEDGYKTLEECGIQSNANGFKLNRKKLNAINKVLWGDD
jgi:hypothetical protein